MPGAEPSTRDRPSLIGLGPTDPDVVGWTGADVPDGGVHEALRDLLPPPRFAERVAFRFFGLRVGREVVALLDVSVDDGDHALVQQVHTAPELRGRGLGARLLAEVVRRMTAEGRAAVYVAADDNVASLALARSVGFVDAMTLVLVHPLERTVAAEADDGGPDGG